MGNEKKTINIKNFGGTPPGVRPVCPGDTSHLSRDVSRLAKGTFCPFSIDLHINQAQMSQVSLGRPEFLPGTPPGHPTAKFLYLIFLYRFFFSPLQGPPILRVPKTGHGEVWVYRGTGKHPAECGANNLGEIPQRNWELQIPCFEEVSGGREHFGTRPCQSPSRLGIRLHFLRPHFPSPPPPKKRKPAKKEQKIPTPKSSRIS